MNELLSLRDRFLEAQLAGDTRAALRMVREDGLGVGVSIPDLYLNVIQASQYRVGKLWQDNLITVAREHLATGIAYLAITSLYPDLPRAPDTGQRALVACVEGERHDLGARMTADFLEMAGIDTHYLGASVPTESLVALACEEQPDLVVLSMTMSFHVEALRHVVASLRSALGDRLCLALGGQAFVWAPTLIGQLQPDAWGRYARETLVAVRRVLMLKAL